MGRRRDHSGGGVRAGEPAEVRAVIRVVIVDDQLLVRSGTRMLCDSVDDLEVVGEADNGGAAVAVARTSAPDVVLMDLRMPGMDGIRATRAIVDERPSARVLILTTFADDENLYAALSAGACGFLAKDVSPDELVDAVRRAAAGDSPFSAPILKRLVTHALSTRTQPARRPSPEVPLSEREREVLDRIRDGAGNGTIAEDLGIGVTTVKTHIAHLTAKTGRNNRVQLAVYATERALRTG